MPLSRSQHRIMQANGGEYDGDGCLVDEVKAELKELQQQIEADSPPDVRAFAHDVGVFGEALDHDLDVGLRALDKRAAPIVHAAEQDSAAATLPMCSAHGWSQLMEACFASLPLIGSFADHGYRSAPSAWVSSSAR